MPKVHGIELSRQELDRRVGSRKAAFGVDLVELADGAERGVRVLRFRSGGGLVAEVFVDRCMDVGTMELHGVPLGFRSPTGFVHPALVDVEAEAGLGWLRGFTGLLNTCGLDHVMGPEEEAAPHYRYRLRHKVIHGLHGRAAYLPARLAGYGERWDGDACVLWAEGEIRQATMFGENLLLQRRIEVPVGGTELTIHDTVTNDGMHPTPHALLYHCNAGWPVVSEHSRLVAEIENTPAMFHDPSLTSIGAVEQAAPQRNFLEQVYEHKVKKPASGLATAAMVNPAFAWATGGTGIGLEIGWDLDAMPALYQWQNLQEGNYVVGIEPCTIHAGNREDWKRRGELHMLTHGESKTYTLRLRGMVGV